jgi:hypothetical protein
MVVYLVTNKENGMQYVGQTSQTIRQRWFEHMSHSRQGRSQAFICRAIRKYTPEAFEIEVLQECNTKEEMDIVEIFYIAFLNTRAPQGYNLTDGGGGVLGYVATAETRKKISEYKKGNTDWLGKHHTKETKQKMSESQKNRPKSLEEMERIKLLGKAQKGYRHSEASRKKMSEIGLRRKQSPEHVAKRITATTETIRQNKLRLKEGNDSWQTKQAS